MKQRKSDCKMGPEWYAAYLVSYHGNNFLLLREKIRESHRHILTEIIREG